MTGATEQTKKEDLKPLRVVAKDKEDLQSISALLQDALVPAISMVYSHEEKRFFFHAFRFMWEEFHKAENANAPSTRVFSTVVFEYVTAVQKHNFASYSEHLTELNLLSVEFLNENQVKLNFSDEKTVLIHMEKLEVYLGDQEQLWETSYHPTHI